MANQKKRAPRYVTPEGSSLFARLFTPDFEYKKELGAYNIILKVGDDAGPVTLKGEPVGDLKDFIDAAVEKAYAAAQAEAKPNKKAKIIKAFPYEEDLDRDTGQPTGLTNFKFGTNACYKDKHTGNLVQKQLTVIDAHKNDLERNNEIGHGSEIKVCFEMQPYYIAATNTSYLKLYLVAVQVLELAQFSGGAKNEFDDCEPDEEVDAQEMF